MLIQGLFKPRGGGAVAIPKWHACHQCPDLASLFQKVDDWYQTGRPREPVVVLALHFENVAMSKQMIPSKQGFVETAWEKVALWVPSLFPGHVTCIHVAISSRELSRGIPCPGYGRVGRPPRVPSARARNQGSPSVSVGFAIGVASSTCHNVHLIQVVKPAVCRVEVRRLVGRKAVCFLQVHLQDALRHPGIRGTRTPSTFRWPFGL